MYILYIILIIISQSYINVCMHINILYIIYVLFYTHTHTHTYIHTGTSLVAQSVKNLQCRRPQFNP